MKNGAVLRIPEFTFGINRDLASLESDWQAFPGHYLLYASSGAFTLEVEDKQWMLPPQRAAWVAADTLIRIRAGAPVTSSSILFARDSIPPSPFQCRVFAVTPLAREMILHAMRWGIDRDPQDRTADQFFGAVASVCAELAANPEQFWLPRARSQELSCAMEYILCHVGAPLSVAEIAQATNVSERTLARRFVDEAQLTCGQFVRRVKLLRAMELLAQPAMPVSEVAFAVGFASISAFNAGFRRFTQQTPSEYGRLRRST